MKFRRHLPFIIMLLLVVGTFGVVVTMTVGQASAINLGNIAPLAANSGPNNHVFYLRTNSNTNGGSQTGISLNAYYPASISPAAWNASKITIDPGAADASATDASGKYVCQAKPSGDSAIDDHYLYVSIGDLSNPLFNTVTYFIKRSNVCRQPTTPNYRNVANISGNNQLYGSYGLPSKPAVDPSSGMIKLGISISYNPIYAPSDAGGIRMKVAGSNSLIGQGGGASHRFPILASWADHVSGGNVSHIYVPFGLSCTATAAVSQKIGVYDADNGSGFPDPVYFQVKNADTGNYVNLNTPENYNPHPGATTATKVTPADGSSQFSGAYVTVNPHTKYILDVEGIDTNNTLDLRLPDNAESIFGSDSFNYSSCSGSTGPSTQSVYVTPSVNGQSDQVEVDDPVSFSQSASVSNSVALGVETWGYRERATQASNNDGTTPSQTTYMPQQVYQRSGDSLGLCATDGEYESGSGNCLGSTANRKKWQCDDGSKAAPCPDGKVYWICRDSSGTKGDLTIGYSNTRPDCGIYNVRCRNADGMWRSTYDEVWGRNISDCTNFFYCPGGDPFNSYDPADATHQCRIFSCANASDAQHFYTAPSNQPKDKCRYRCPLGAGTGNGDFAPLSQPDNPDSGIDKHSAGDLNCYLPPGLQFSCQFDSAGGTAGPVSTTWSYNQATGIYTSGESNTYCAGLPGSTTSRSTPNAQQVCATSSIVPGNLDWLNDATHMPPGYGLNAAGDAFRERVHWIVSVGAPDTDCQDLGYKPYMKVYHGMVKAGNYLKYDSVNAKVTCGTGDGNVYGHNKGAVGAYMGAGTTDGVVALGNINGFTSSNAQATFTPKGLTFANASSDATNSANGEYGGRFGGFSEDCDSYTSNVMNAQHYSSSTLDGPTIIVHDGLSIPSGLVSDGGTFVHDGDLHITGDSYYGGPVSDIMDLPHFKMIVLGNIYIDSSVSHLAGDYVAIEKDGTGGSIVTCVDASGATVTQLQRYAQCNSSLRVDGSLNAKSIKFLRTKNSLRDSSGDVANDPAQTSAAEIINYGPESWLPTSNNISNSYNSITGLPPIL